MKKVNEIIKALVKTYRIDKIMVNEEEYYVYFTIFIKNKNNKKVEGLQIKYPTGLIQGLVIDELLRRFEHLIDLKLLEIYKLEEV
ncbi:MAG: hypothetical protein J6T23_06045 [Elusimicrobia bacterium]|nr:hypothetical protein [Elusimicrobiota bacterium]